MKPAQRHELGGRVFTVIGESTIEHDFHFMGLVKAAGLDRPTLRIDESPGDFAVRILGELLGSGHACEMLGCLLIPEGIRSEDWTPKIAAETATFIGRLADPSEKQKVRALVLSLLIDFFERGLASWRASRMFSGQTEEAPLTPDAGLPGATSSESSPATTSTEQRG